MRRQPDQKIELNKIMLPPGLSSGPSKRQKMEDKVDVVFQDLKEKHGSNFSTPQLCMWARMVSNDLHDDFEEPPNIPAFSSTPHQPSVSGAVSGAAIAITKAGICQECQEYTSTEYLAVESMLKLKYTSQILTDVEVNNTEPLASESILVQEFTNS